MLPIDDFKDPCNGRVYRTCCKDRAKQKARYEARKAAGPAPPPPPATLLEAVKAWQQHMHALMLKDPGLDHSKLHPVPSEDELKQLAESLRADFLRDDQDEEEQKAPPAPEPEPVPEDVRIAMAAAEMAKQRRRENRKRRRAAAALQNPAV